ncbi:MAG: hypothetical protein IJ348_02310 [Alistipes sp.]|nr:hypothetical protein [Alistipes sp.]
MKRKFFTYLSIMAGAMLSGGCFQPNEEQIPHNEGRTVSITAGQSEVTRAYVSSVGASESTTQAGYSLVWDAEDAIGVYLSGPTTESNCKFTSTSGKGASEATFTGKFQSDATSGTHTYYAYSPYNANAGSDPTAVSGALSATQIQSNTEGTHIGKYMLEIAKATASDNGGTSLTFQNQFSILNFKIKYRAQDAVLNGAKVSNVRVYAASEIVTDSNENKSATPLHASTYNFAGNYTVNLESQTVTMATSSYSWIVDCVVQGDNVVSSTTDDGALDVWVVVNPVNLNGVKLVAEIITDKGTFLTSRSITSNGGQLKPNAVYVLPATIKLPKITPNMFPLWTEGDSFFSTLILDNGVNTLPSDAASAVELKPSNCFMVQPNTLYKFNANIRGRGAAGLEAMGITTDSIIGDYAVTAEGRLTTSLADESWLYFKTSTTGNAVVSLYFGGTVLWSWHIWSLNDTPSDVQVAANVHMLDRNLGATTIAPTATGTNNNAFYNETAAGLYYCWGINTPYPGYPTGNLRVSSATYGVNMRSATTALTNIFYYNGTSSGVETTTRLVIPSSGLSTTIMVPQSPADLTSNSEINTATDAYLRMWGYSEDGVYKKTAFDPCPYGYMVPNSDLLGCNSDRYQIDGIETNTIIHKCAPLYYNDVITTYLPKMGIVGLLNTDNEWKIQNPAAGYYWTATPAEVSQNGSVISTSTWNQETGKFQSKFENECNNRRAMSHYFETGVTHFPFAISRFQGLPVRCVRCPEESGSPTK